MIKARLDLWLEIHLLVFMHRRRALFCHQHFYISTVEVMNVVHLVFQAVDVVPSHLLLAWFTAKLCRTDVISSQRGHSREFALSFHDSKNCMPLGTFFVIHIYIYTEEPWEMILLVTLVFCYHFRQVLFDGSIHPFDRFLQLRV